MSYLCIGLFIYFHLCPFYLICSATDNCALGGAGRVAARPRCTYCTEMGRGEMRAALGGVQWLLSDLYSHGY